MPARERERERENTLNEPLVSFEFGQQTRMVELPFIIILNSVASLTSAIVASASGPPGSLMGHLKAVARFGLLDLRALRNLDWRNVFGCRVAVCSGQTALKRKAIWPMTTRTKRRRRRRGIPSPLGLSKQAKWTCSAQADRFESCSDQD